MKALYYDELKGHAGIRLGEFPVPVIDDTEVLVRVKAFSLNHLDVWVMEGKYSLAIPLPHIFGSDASGVVEKAGKLVTHVKQGDEVMVFPGLSCGVCASCMSGRENECRDFSLLGVVPPGVSAEYVKAPAQNIFRNPTGLSFEEAAGSPGRIGWSDSSLALAANALSGSNGLPLGPQVRLPTWSDGKG